MVKILIVVGVCYAALPIFATVVFKVILWMDRKK